MISIILSMLELTFQKYLLLIKQKKMSTKYGMQNSML